MTADAVGEQILADVIAHPDDDGVRLVYADWCEDAGRAERAELIRVQMALEALAGHEEPAPPKGAGGQVVPRCRKCDERDGLHVREGELLAKHGHDWLKTPGLATYSSWHGFPVEGLLSKKEGGPGIEIGVTVRRGFIEEAGCPLQAWINHGPALVRAHPLRKVTLTDCRQEHISLESGHAGGWANLVGAANPPPGANLQEFLAGPPFSHELWPGIVTALCLGSRYHPTRGAAVTFLSDSALVWARAEADRRDEHRKRLVAYYSVV